MVADGEIKRRITYVSMGRFLTDKNINFNAIQNVISALWRPREGMEIIDWICKKYWKEAHGHLNRVCWCIILSKIVKTDIQLN